MVVAVDPEHRVTGAPVMCNFLSRAHSLFLDDGKLSSADSARFRNVFLFRNRHDSLERTTLVDLTNIEQVFGLIDLSIRADPDRNPSATIYFT